MASIVRWAALAAGFWAGLAAAAAPAPAGCAAPRPTVLVERYLSADCEACWQSAPPLPPDTAAAAPFVLDWIVPGASGEAAPLAVAALPEAAARVARASALRPDEALTQTTPLPARALHVEVQDGPAWNGYIGLRLEARYDATRPLPAGLAGWLALVERVPAGSEGTPVERRLVRALVGPLPAEALAAGRPVEHLRAVRLPPNARPERLSAVGWLETPAGRVLAVGAPRDAGCVERPKPP